MISDPASAASQGRDFIRQIIDRDLESGAIGGEVVTRFPPEPNGFLHIGHAKAIVLNFGLAKEYPRARCHLRFDDTNPATEEVRYVEAMQEDIRWLGYDWGSHLYFASDYFPAMYGFAEELIQKGLAYVDSQTDEEVREQRGTVTEPGRPSPNRDRSVEENLDLFRRMRAGEFEDGAHVLRARIDMASGNMLMRDPLLYRIRHAHHYRTGSEWCIYPLYDYAHPIEDALEGVTHSLCSLEFANNRELYDWVVEHVSVPSRPHQYEFARLNLDYTVMSKRRFLRLVGEGDVAGWDDPRMPTLAGLRRRGFTPDAIRAFCEMVGVARAETRVDMAKLEYSIRDDLNRKAPRVLAVLRPLKVTLIGWPKGKVEEIQAPYFPHDVPLEGSRTVPFSGELFIDRDDFREKAPKGFHRLVPGGEVRLRYAYVIRCEEVVKDAAGTAVELRCSWDPATGGRDAHGRVDGERPAAGRGPAAGGRGVKGTIQWVSAAHALRCDVRLYDRLFTVPDPDAEAARSGRDFRELLNPGSLEVVTDAVVEPSVAEDPAETRYQFERVGYFWRDPVDGTGKRPVFNRIVTLRDTWARTAEDGTVLSDGADPAEKAPRARAKATAPLDSAVRSRPGARTAGSRGGATPVGDDERPAPDPATRKRAERLVESFELSDVDAEILARDPGVEAFFRAAVAVHDDAAAIANWIINILPPIAEGRPIEELPFGPEALARVVSLVDRAVVSGRGGTAVLEVLARDGGDPEEIVRRLNLGQVSDPASLARTVQEVLREHPAKVEAFRSGKAGIAGFFMGRIMERTGGRADPKVAKKLLEEALK